MPDPIDTEAERPNGSMWWAHARTSCTFTAEHRGGTCCICNRLILCGDRLARLTVTEPGAMAPSYCHAACAPDRKLLDV